MRIYSKLTVDMHGLISLLLSNPRQTIQGLQQRVFVAYRKICRGFIFSKAGFLLLDANF